MARFLDAQRLARYQSRWDPRLSMLCDITRNMGSGEIAPGYPGPPDMQPILTDQICYVWNLLYLLQGEFTFPEREYPSGSLRALLPHGMDILEQDEIQNIRDAAGEVLFEGPLNIFLVVPHSIVTLLVLRGAH